MNDYTCTCTCTLVVQRFAYFTYIGKCNQIAEGCNYPVSYCKTSVDIIRNQTRIEKEGFCGEVGGGERVRRVTHYVVESRTMDSLAPETITT